jgi:hypothetical protein
MNYLLLTGIAVISVLPLMSLAGAADLPATCEMSGVNARLAVMDMKISNNNAITAAYGGRVQSLEEGTAVAKKAYDKVEAAYAQCRRGAIIHVPQTFGATFAKHCNFDKAVVKEADPEWVTCVQK